MINFVFLILYEYIRIVIYLNIYTVHLIIYRYITSLVALTIKEIIILQLKNNFRKYLREAALPFKKQKKKRKKVKGKKRKIHFAPIICNP